MTILWWVNNFPPPLKLYFYYFLDLPTCIRICWCNKWALLLVNSHWLHVNNGTVLKPRGTSPLSPLASSIPLVGELACSWLSPFDLASSTSLVGEIDFDRWLSDSLDPSSILKSMPLSPLESFCSIVCESGGVGGAVCSGLGLYLWSPLWIFSTSTDGLCWVSVSMVQKSCGWVRIILCKNTNKNNI